MRSGKDKAALTVRRAVPGDIEDLKELWKDCFGDTDAFTDYYFEQYFPENETFTALLEGKRIGQLHINPYRLQAGCRQIRGAYIVGVATAAYCRHRGVMTALLEQVFDQLFQEKLPFAYLMPADERIYRPFGFSWMYRQEALVLLPPSEDPCCFAGTGGDAALKGPDRPAAGTFPAFRVTPAREAYEYEELAEISNALLSVCRDIYTLRDTRYFQRLQLENRADGGDLLIFRDQNGIIAYVSFACEGSVEVREAWVRPGLEDLLYTWMARVFAGRQTVILPLTGRPAGPGDEKIVRSPSGGACFARRFRPIIMGRIICLQSFLDLICGREEEPDLMRWDGSETEDGQGLLLWVEDAQISENCGLWLWDPSGKRGPARHLKGPGRGVELTDAQADIYLEIGTLLEWLTGYTPVTELAGEGRIRIREGCMEKLQAVPVLNRIFINEIV